MTGSQLDLLAEIDVFSPITAADLAEFLGERVDTTQRRIQRLARRGLVEHTRYNLAGASARWVLTDTGAREARR
jgi:DNA-binding MarR family transcriptional regulator